MPDAGDPSLRLLSAIGDALSLLLDPGDFDDAMQRALELVGRATGVDRVYIFENHTHPNSGEALMSQRYEWVAEGVSEQIQNPEIQDMPYSRIPGWFEMFQMGRTIQKNRDDFTPAERLIVDPQDIQSLMCRPIVLRGKLWGFVGFDDCNSERDWTERHHLALKAVAAGLGGVIIRREAEQSLAAKASELKRQRSVALSLMEDARAAEQKAEQASRAKSEFLAMMSHDIRTPLNGVIGFTDMLMAESLTEKQAEMVNVIRTCGENLLGIVSDVLDISRIESGHLRLDPTVGRIAAVVEAAVGTFRLGRTQDISFLSSVSAECPEFLRLDFDRFNQILTNLIGNAAKFTRKGSIETRVWCEPADSRHVRLFCSVHDTGLGISTDDLVQIFEPFRQGDSARRTASGGSGLGLAICRSLAEAMGGNISAESEVERGSTFTFHVLAEKVSPEIAGATDAEQFTPVENLRVLVVDDVSVNVRLVLNLLHRLGCEADSVNSGEAALKATAEKSYDIVFLDILMPELDGFETIREMRHRDAEAGKKDPWVIALTADALVENRQRCIAAGMNDFITKPVRLADVQASLARWQKSAKSA